MSSYSPVLTLKPSIMLWCIHIFRMGWPAGVIPLKYH